MNIFPVKDYSLRVRADFLNDSELLLNSAERKIFWKATSFYSVLVAKVRQQAVDSKSVIYSLNMGVFGRDCFHIGHPTYYIKKYQIKVNENILKKKSLLFDMHKFSNPLKI